MWATYRVGVRIIRTALACAIAFGWLFVTLMILLAGNLMSVDEEWEGWGDVLLNPYLIVPYLAITTGAALGVWALRRRPT